MALIEWLFIVVFGGGLAVAFTVGAILYVVRRWEIFLALAVLLLIAEIF